MSGGQERKQLSDGRWPVIGLARAHKRLTARRGRQAGRPCRSSLTASYAGFARAHLFGWPMWCALVRDTRHEKRPPASLSHFPLHAAADPHHVARAHSE